MVIKTQLCAFSESRIYPGHGSMCCRRDGQTFWLGSKKAKSMYEQRKKPQKLAWTQAWRRLHKKNVDNRQKKKVSVLVQSPTTAFVPVGPEYVFSVFPSTTADLFFSIICCCLSSLCCFLSAHTPCTKIHPCRQWYGHCCFEKETKRKEIQTCLPTKIAIARNQRQKEKSQSRTQEKWWRKQKQSHSRRPW